ncbi:metallophosphoesterase [Xanthomonas sp. 3058]|uniref:metallophosphoesterase family protein n=1 Tax=Xanthomonas sp. 3058 TaxID=3035314 RepID=UPI00161BCDCE|nr:metallophosphoesterase [Xanthomonas sp. 3058]MBB5865096.1 putative phosphodiesterase [Xanthomonas sp. 3058]
MATQVRIAVLSDLHFASDEDGSSDTHVILSRQSIPKQDPYGDVLDLIARENLSADIVLCPGDITYQADQSALRSAWAALNEVTAKLGASHLIAATGNHDISSRDSTSSPEIWEYLKQLSPTYPFPGATTEQRLHYWSEHFMIVELDGLRLVVLNSCNCHARGVSEWANGRVTDHTIAEIEKRLNDTLPGLINVLLCHHHPSKHPDMNQFFPDYSEMKQGLKLLSMLGERDEPWVVVHGHKHSPRLSNAEGSSSDEVTIFSAGSFSAVLAPQYFPGASNQFYIIELDLDYVSANGAAGVVYAWDWREGQGWMPASPESRFGSRIVNGTGFGHKCNVNRDASDIASTFSGRANIKWREVVDMHPWVTYLSPRDLGRILARLKSYHYLDGVKDGAALFPHELLRSQP